MGHPSPSTSLPVGIAVGVFLSGSLLISLIQTKNDSDKRSARAALEAQATKKAEACIDSPSKDECLTIDPKLLSVDVSSRLKAALLKNSYSKSLESSQSQSQASTISFDLYQACKNYIGEVMGRKPSIMASDYLDRSRNIVGISYSRPSDRKTFKYECRIDGQSITWRGVDIFRPGEGPGRWRLEDSRPVARYN